MPETHNPCKIFKGVILFTFLCVDFWVYCIVCDCFVLTSEMTFTSWSLVSSVVTSDQFCWCFKLLVRLTKCGATCTVCFIREYNLFYPAKKNTCVNLLGMAFDLNLSQHTLSGKTLRFSVTRQWNLDQTLCSYLWKFAVNLVLEQALESSTQTHKFNTESTANPHPVICDFSIISATVNVLYTDVIPH